jgi:cysteine-S-conjugate beta-lyase
LEKTVNYDFDSSVKREASNGEKYALREKLFGTEDVLPMWVADMDIDTPAFIIEALNQRLKHPNFGYEEIPQSTLEAQIAWMQRHHGVTLEKKDLLYSHSVVASINAAIEVFSDKGDKVIVQTPVYPPFFKSVVRHERNVLLNPLKKDANGDYTFDIEDLEAKIDENTKLLLLCSPHNPVGRVWRKEELDRLAAVCIKHNIVVFSDEIHSDLVYTPHKHIPFATLSKEAAALSVTAVGVGKTFNMAGFAISTVAIKDAKLKERFLSVYEKIHFAHGATLSHVAMQAAYENGDEWLSQLQTHLASNIALLSSVCEKHKNKIAFLPPEGTYLAWLDCSPTGLGDKALREFFIKKARLGLSPGISFGKEGSGFMRLNFAVSKDIMQEAMQRLDRALEEL